MSEAEEYSFQVSGQVHGDLYVVRGKTVAEFKDNLKALGEGEGADSVAELWTAFKQVVVAKGIVTGNATSGSGTGGRGRKADSAPPSSNGDGPPTCKHGAMKDAGDPAETGYKARYYCTLKTDNWKEKCKPQN